MFQRIVLMLAGCCACSAQAQQPPSPAVPSAAPIVKKSWQTVRKDEAFAPMTGEERAHFLLRRVVLSPGAPARAAT